MPVAIASTAPMTIHRRLVSVSVPETGRDIGPGGTPISVPPCGAFDNPPCVDGNPLDPTSRLRAPCVDVEGGCIEPIGAGGRLWFGLPSIEADDGGSGDGIGGRLACADGVLALAG